jgi:hypothetical protein
VKDGPYCKKQSPYWYVQHFDSENQKHDKSTGLCADDPNETAKAKALRAELEANGIVTRLVRLKNIEGEVSRAPIPAGKLLPSSV